MRAYHLFDKWLLNAQCDYIQDEVLDVYVPIKPIGKERTHGTNHSTPEKTRTWEHYVGSVVANDIMEGRPGIDFPVAARVIWGFHKNRADIDNIEKAIWDALQKGGKGCALKDDNLIRGYVEKCEVVVPKDEEEFIWIRFYARRREDYYNYMEKLDDYERNRTESRY